MRVWQFKFLAFSYAKTPVIFATLIILERSLSIDSSSSSDSLTCKIVLLKVFDDLQF